MKEMRRSCLFIYFFFFITTFCPIARACACEVFTVLDNVSVIRFLILMTFVKITVQYVWIHYQDLFY